MTGSCDNTMSAKFKLIYFDTIGLGEPIRYIFALAGVPYEDKRFKKEEWPQLKPTTPYGRVPVLEEDGKQLAGGRVIARYLAEKFGLAGENAFENAEIASIADLLDDYVSAVMKVKREEDETRKGALLTEFQKEIGPKYLGILEKEIEISGGPWLRHDVVTWVDLYLAVIVNLTEKHNKELYEGYPGVMRLVTSVHSLPKIAKWLKERPAPDN